MLVIIVRRRHKVGTVQRDWVTNSTVCEEPINWRAEHVRSKKISWRNYHKFERRPIHCRSDGMDAVHIHLRTRFFNKKKVMIFLFMRLQIPFTEQFTQQIAEGKSQPMFKRWHACETRARFKLSRASSEKCVATFQRCHREEQTGNVAGQRDHCTRIDSQRAYGIAIVHIEREQQRHHIGYNTSVFIAGQIDKVVWWGAAQRHRHALCIAEPGKCHRSGRAGRKCRSGMNRLHTTREFRINSSCRLFSFHRIWCKSPTKKYRNAISSSRRRMQRTTVAIHCSDRWWIWPINVPRCRTFRWRHVNVIFWKSLKRIACEHHTAPKVFYVILVRRQNLHFQIGTKIARTGCPYKGRTAYATAIHSNATIQIVDWAMHRRCRQNGKVNTAKVRVDRNRRRRRSRVTNSQHQLSTSMASLIHRCWAVVWIVCRCDRNRPTTIPVCWAQVHWTRRWTTHAKKMNWKRWPLTRIIVTSTHSKMILINSSPTVSESLRFSHARRIRQKSGEKNK